MELVAELLFQLLFGALEILVVGGLDTVPGRLVWPALAALFGAAVGVLWASLAGAAGEGAEAIAAAAAGGAFAATIGGWAIRSLGRDRALALAADGVVLVGTACVVRYLL